MGRPKSEACAPASSNFAIHAGIAYNSSAGNNGLKLCGNATWEGIIRSIARQWCGQPSVCLGLPGVPICSLDAGAHASKNPASWTTATKFREELTW